MVGKRLASVVLAFRGAMAKLIPLGRWSRLPEWPWPTFWGYQTVIVDGGDAHRAAYSLMALNPLMNAQNQSVYHGMGYD